MKRKLACLAQGYATALQEHLQPGPRASLMPARELGRQAVVLGLEPLDLARIHEATLAGLKNGSRKRAAAFFDEALTPIVETQRAVARRKVRAVAAAKTDKHHKQCLQESLELQKRLRQLTYRVLATQEDERTKISRELQNEIAQTLLGINVRLLSLKQEARNNTAGLRKEIASTQRLVLKSAKSVRRVAREF